MTTTTSTTISIGAPPERVWQLVTDPEWWNRAENGVVSVDGAIREGEKITLVSELQPKRGFSLTVAEMRPSERMTWTGGMPLGLCTGRRSFVLEPSGEQTCTFTMAEDFVGPLSPLIIRSLPDFQSSFDTFARALKADSEA
ncbi:SRPBCC domain-containing protein [uncultured Phycicoccus sp.]|uniref:SRPBCC domain-containing protein n=1 Tax=uncultured Phycicoccus sp. TaxID=661422 RepID=UPI0026170783|nr:SRPBCC domain-containing protein [uncultured Phycicoccus sp.]